MPQKERATKSKKKNTPKKPRYVAVAILSIISIFSGLSLISYDPADPSFNHAVDYAATNWGGVIGAYIADPVLQIVGIAAYLLPIITFFWAAKFIKKQRVSLLPVRLMVAVFAIISLSALGSFLDAPQTWPFPTLGGVMGDILRDDLVPFITSYGLALLATLVLLASFAFSIALTREEFDTMVAISRRLASFCFKVIKQTMYGISYIKNTAVSALHARRRSQKKVSIEQDEIAEPSYAAPSAPKTKPVLQNKTVTQVSLPLIDKAVKLPSITLLASPKSKSKLNKFNESALSQNARLLEKVLEDFGVQGEITKVRPGPVVTLYELEPAAGTKSSRVVGLADDIARSMSAISARIAVIPGRNAIGIELPNVDRETVFLRELIERDEFQSKKISLPLALGKDIGGDTVIADLAKMPHLLVAGTTGSGKSVAVNSMILSILYRLSPEQCRFIMIDPKMLELSVYDGIPHLLSPVVTEPHKAVTALKWVVREMENRYRSMSSVSVRNIAGYNKRIEEAIQNDEVLERNVQTGFDPETGRPITEKIEIEKKPLPFIVVVIDEMADLMLVAGKEIEGAIQRLAQMARAAGIHIITATQRPSVDVITGVIKANFPTRISFQVTSKIDSRTILGEMGAEQLLGMGDMLYMAGGSRTTRVHGPFVDDKEVEKVVKFLKSQGTPNYIDEVLTEDEGSGDIIGMPGGGDLDKDASLYDQAVAIVLRDKRASTSYVQRQLKIGYNRAANLIDKMEEEGVVSAPNSKGRREVLVGEHA